MELKGTIIQVFDEQNGISKKGDTWRIQPFLLETDDQYPRKVYIEVFGDERIKNAHINRGAHVDVGIDVESTEYNGRWYTKVRAWKVQKDDANAGDNTQTAEAKALNPDGNTDLPF